MCKVSKVEAEYITYYWEIKTLSVFSFCFFFLSPDVNDNVPFFTSSIYEASVTEGAQIGASVLQVSAHDKDLGLNGQVRNSLCQFKPNKSAHFQFIGMHRYWNGPRQQSLKLLKPGNLLPGVHKICERISKQMYYCCLHAVPAAAPTIAPSLRLGHLGRPLTHSPHAHAHCATPYSHKGCT